MAGEFGEMRLAPVDPSGAPVYHATPVSSEAARSDGERWRWLLAQAAATGETGRAEATLDLADFMRSQIGETRSNTGPACREMARRARSRCTRSATMRPLARLATGPRRFVMPDEFNYVKLYREARAESRPAPRATGAGESRLGLRGQTSVPACG